VSIKQQAVIRQLSSDDVDIFRRLRLEALLEEPLSFASVYDDWAQLSDDEWRHHLDHPVFVAFVDGRPVGMMGVKFQRPSRFSHRATIIGVYVQKGQRGSGMATQLLGHVIQHAKDHAVLQLELSVNAENSAAVRFYQRHGFLEVGRIPDGFRGHNMEADEVIMVLRLNR
jgi:ribosomal protein S18 acetylase RimI-like enzyme